MTTIRRWPLVAGVLLAIAAIVWGVPWLCYRTTHSISKDAFVESHLINLAPQVAGNIVAVYVQEQDVVKQGQLLAIIDPSTYRRDVEIAEAKEATAKAAYEKAQTDLALATQELPRRIAIAEMKFAIAKEDERSAADNQAMVAADTDQGTVAARKVVDFAKAVFVLADEDFIRYQTLFKEGSVSERKFQEATRSHKTAKSEVEIAEAKLAQAEANRSLAKIAGQKLESARHGVKQSAASLELAKLGDLQVAAAQRLVNERAKQVVEAGRARELAQVNLGYTNIVAPYDAVISKKWRHLGDYARAGDPIFSVYNPDLMFVTVHLEETRLEGVNPGCRADLQVDAFRQPFTGRVVWVGSATGANFSLIPRDLSSGEFTYVVQRVPTRIVIERDERWKLLKPGLSVTASIAHGPGDAAWAAEANRKLGEIMGVESEKK